MANSDNIVPIRSKNSQRTIYIDDELWGAMKKLGADCGEDTSTIIRSLLAFALEGKTVNIDLLWTVTCLRKHPLILAAWEEKQAALAETRMEKGLEALKRLGITPAMLSSYLTPPPDPPAAPTPLAADNAPPLTFAAQSPTLPASLTLSAGSIATRLTAAIKDSDKYDELILSMDKRGLCAHDYDASADGAHVRHVIEGRPALPATHKDLTLIDAALTEIGC